MTKQEIFNRYLPKKLEYNAPVSAFAPSNIALCKYWGKRDQHLNLPNNASLSISLDQLGTTTSVSINEEDNNDEIWLNGETVPINSTFSQKIVEFLDLFRREQTIPLKIKTTNTIPTAAGLASSASGFAALTLALSKFFSLALPLEVLSQLARMGSGSAARSVFTGFVEWKKGVRDDGSDSFAVPLNETWESFRIGILELTDQVKPVDSRTGMQHTIETSMLYESWAAQASRDLETIKHAISSSNMTQLGETAENNALSMHATMISSHPSLLYWLPETVEVMHQIWAMRKAGIEVYLTMDAGPNIKLIFSEDTERQVLSAFNNLVIVNPFS